MNKSFLVIIFIAIVSFSIASTSVAQEAHKANSATDTELVSETSTHNVAHELPNPLMVIPFVILLIMIATGPILYPHFWEHQYPKVSVLLGSIVVYYYWFILHNTLSLLHTAAEYFSFIALLASLFYASGGIMIKVDRKATPFLNVAILLFGAIIANLIGTTGASMLLIRPFIKINQDRIKPYLIVFFIFIVSNIGGALTPIGDPPLFLGFLRGIDFFWFIEHIWYIWLPTIALILIIFYIFDSRNKEYKEGREYSGKIEFKGSKNLIYLAIILLAVFIDPNVMSWVPNLQPSPIGIREIIQFGVVILAIKTSDEKILKYNEFDAEPIREVAFLFIGIFATMIPALQLISHEANVLGDKLTVGMFFWSTGLLSGVLDNAPTYLNFLSAALGKFGLDVNTAADVKEFMNIDYIFLQAISVAAVFFGAMTYIGNGPNFMVKSIVERAGIEMPSFFAYVYRYSLPILIPVFILVWLVFYF
ncbi:MAG: sodium:proton antiporter [Bacteroidetes bacterium]|nr:sodium:proton antiporter [Bacteroidota bacterium]MBU1114548.1 sodium:proton antiporter [Bacteroidota bacterium]MBU1798615.1 sodium:proton antiporter [Bacteroidota bacterium]